MKRLEVEGQRFGRLVVVSEGPKQNVTEKRPEGLRSVVCQCDCGNLTTVLLMNLVAGKVTSCGCVRKEQLAARNTATKTTHGGRRHELYATWTGMRARCLNPDNPGYRSYGGRGIGISPRWVNDFGTFVADIEAEIGPRPSGKSLDRKDNDGNYEPGNVQWATPREQMINRRSVHVLTARIRELEEEVRVLRAQLPAG
jgi:hypothetical protein